MQSAASASVMLVAASAAVPTVTLPNGVEMPMVAAGTFTYTSDEAEYSVDRALESGYTMVDTAYDYHNQDGVGRALHAAFANGLAREDVFVETKAPGCQLDPDISYDFCYENTTTVLYKNLELLNLSYVDLVILHMPPLGSMIARSCAKAEETICDRVNEQWRAMEEFYKAKKARAIGVSNYCPSCYDCLDGTEIFPMLNQLQLHVGWGKNPRNSETVNEDLGVVTQAYAALGLNPNSQDPDILHGNLTNSIAVAHNKSAAQVALKWIVDQGIPLAVRSNNSAHLKANLDLFDWNLTADETTAIDKYIDGSKIIPSFACDLWPGDDPSSTTTTGPGTPRRRTPPVTPPPSSRMAFV